MLRLTNKQLEDLKLTRLLLQSAKIRLSNLPELKQSIDKIELDIWKTIADDMQKDFNTCRV